MVDSTKTAAAKKCASTRDRLLDVAEELFAEKGISGTSLRVLTRSADANLAAVHYHFGSKDGLVDAVFERRAASLNRERLADLAHLEACAAPEPPGVEDILTAFILPGTRTLQALGDRRALLVRLWGRLEAEPPEVVEATLRKHFGSVCAQFLEALQRSLPNVGKELVAERFRICLAALSSAFSNSSRLDTIPGHPSAQDGEDRRVERLIAFLSAGLRAEDPTHRTTPS